MRFPALVTSILFLLLTACFASAEVEICNVRMGGIPISEEALQALQASKAHFDIQAVSKVVDGKPRIIILAGESHVKSLEHAKLGEDLIHQFSFRGVEGADLDNSLASKLMKPVLGILKLTAKFRNQAGSSIDYASMDAQLTEASAMFADAIQNKIIEDSTALTPEIEASIMKFLEQIKITFDGVEQSGSVLYPRIKKILEERTAAANSSVGQNNSQVIAVNTDAAAAMSRNKSPVVVELEEGHVQGFAEKIHMLMLASPLYGIPIELGLSFVPNTGSIVFDTAKSVVQYGLGAIIGYTYAQSKLTKKNLNKSWFKLLFPFGDGLGHGRNLTMVRNIEKAFDEYPDQDQMLVIVGKNHVEDMKRILIREQGYQSADVP